MTTEPQAFYVEAKPKRLGWWEPRLPPPVKHVCIGGPEKYSVEVRENDATLSCEPIDCPFVVTGIQPRGWRVALAVLLRRYKIEVCVRGNHELEQKVLELDPDYLGLTDSERRRKFQAQLNRALEEL